MGELLEQKTVAKLRAYSAAFDGVLGIAAIDLTNGHAFSINGDTVFTLTQADDPIQ